MSKRPQYYIKKHKQKNMADNLKTSEHYGAELPPVPHIGGDLLSPEAQSGPEGRLEAASDVLDTIKQLPGDLDGHVADLVESANHFFTDQTTSSALGHAVEADTVGVLHLLDGPEADATVRELVASPIEPLGEALSDLQATDPTGLAVEAVVDMIDRAVDHPPENYWPDKFHVEKLIDPVKTAREYLEAMGGDVTNEALLAVANRITRERPTGLVGLNYMKRTLAHSNNDKPARLRQVESFARADMERTEIITHAGVGVLLASLDIGTALDKIAGEQSPGLMHLASLQSENRMDFEDDSIEAHYNAIRIIAESSGVSPLDWIKMVAAGRGDSLPWAAQQYAAKPELPKLVVFEVLNRDREQFDAALRKNEMSISQRVEQQSHFRETLNGALEILMQTPEARKLAQRFMEGDIQKYGFDKKFLSLRRPKPKAFNEKGFNSALHYLTIATEVGIDKMVDLNHSLGIVNFCAYSAESLNNMREILINPSGRHEVSLYIRGQDGDHNGAFMNELTGHYLSNTLAFEVGTAKDLERVERMVTKLGLPIGKVTLAGHGGDLGIYLSSHLRIERNERALRKQKSLISLIDRIVPDGSGEKNVLLISCSQGCEYYQGRSMAQILAHVTDGNVVVEAAPRVSYTYDTEVHGEKRVMTNRYFEISDTLNLFRAIPGVKRLVDNLRRQDRMKAGTLRVSKQGTTPNDSGIVKIGA